MSDPTAGTPGRPVDVVVIGGGLAGITAALACADAGRSVTLLEARPRLGGRTASFRREIGPVDGDSPTDVDPMILDVDTGQHVFMRCCTAYLALLARLGVRDDVFLQPRLDVPVLTPGRTRPVRITRTRAPAPLHLGSALAGYRLLPWSRRLRLVIAALALRGVDPADPAVDERSFGHWLGAHGQDAATIAALWDLITVATLNSPARDSSLALAATVFQLGLLTSNSAGDLGWATVPLGRLHGDAARTQLEKAGVRVELGTKVTGLAPGPNLPWQVPRSGPGGEISPLEAAQVVLATPPAVAEKLLPPGALPWEPGWSQHLSSSPIVNVHVVYDRPVLPEPFLAAVGSPVQWIFDRTASAGLDPEQGQYLAVSLSAAGDLIGRPAAEVTELILPALARLLPAAGRAVVRDAFVTREPAATFAPAPGTTRWRPPPTTALPGLVLAGSWTATGWPDTMEGAVRSGNSAAMAVLATTGTASANQPQTRPNRPQPLTEVPS